MFRSIRCLCHPGLNSVEIDVSHARKQGLFGQQCLGFKTRLPEVPGASVFGICAAGDRHRRSRTAGHHSCSGQGHRASRQKYVRPCCEQYHVTATKPEQPIEKSIAGPSLLAYVATQKYCDALPLYRQSEIFKRAGLESDRTSLANWMIRCGELVQPLVNLLHEQLLEQPVIHLDEATVQMLNAPGKAAESQSYMWVMGSFSASRTVLFHYADSRRQSVPLDLLAESYEKACQQYGITRIGCWAHARRKLMGAKRFRRKAKRVKPTRSWRLSKSCTPWRRLSKSSRRMSVTGADNKKPSRSSTNSESGLRKAYRKCRRKRRSAKRCIVCTPSGTAWYITWMMLIQSTTIGRRTRSARSRWAARTGSLLTVRQAPRPMS